VIPKSVRDAAEDEFNNFDKNLFPDVQIDIVNLFINTIL